MHKLFKITTVGCIIAASTLLVSCKHKSTAHAATAPTMFINLTKSGDDAPIKYAPFTVTDSSTHQTIVLPMSAETFNLDNPILKLGHTYTLTTDGITLQDGGTCKTDSTSITTPALTSGINQVLVPLSCSKPTVNVTFVDDAYKPKS